MTVRKLAAIPLLLVLVSVASGAIPAVCASECAAAPAHAHAAAMKAHSHHHHAAAGSQNSAGAASTPHCVKAAQPAVAEKALPQAQLAAVAPGVIAEVAAPVARIQLHKQYSARPPGPPVLYAPLRI